MKITKLQQNNNLSFQGKLLPSSLLTNRIKECSSSELRALKRALKRMKATHDGKEYTYEEKVERYNYRGSRYNFDHYGCLIDKKTGEKSYCTTIAYSHNYDCDFKYNNLPPGFISDFICRFVDNRYPQMKK